MTRRFSSLERRRQIVEATLELLATTSVESITTCQVAKHVGVTQPALFRHFLSRDQILAAVVEHARGELETLALAALEHPADPLAALDSLLRGSSGTWPAVGHPVCSSFRRRPTVVRATPRPSSGWSPRSGAHRELVRQAQKASAIARGWIRSVQASSW